MDNVKRGYTTAKTRRLICAVIIALGVNIIYQSIGWKRLVMMVYGVLFVAGHTNIMAAVIYYLVYGVNRKPGLDRIIITWVMLIIFVGVFFFDGGKVILPILTAEYIVLLIFLLLIIVRKETTGDNIIRNGETEYFGGSYFSDVNNAIRQVKVTFPLDIENYRYDRGKGCIRDIGLMEKGKYAGKLCALVGGENSHAYICPLDRIMIEGNTGDVIIAGKNGGIVVKLYDYDKEKSKIMVIGNARLELKNSS
jgi:hypothetical protein